MTSEAFQSFAAGKGWKYAENCAFGAHKNYPFAAQYQAGGVSAVQFQFEVSKPIPGKLIRTINKTLPKGCKATQPVAGRLLLVCGGMDELLENNVRTGLDLVADSFREAGLAVAEKCPCCRQGGCDALALWNGSYVPVHRNCVEEKAGAIAAEAQVNTATGSYVTGFLGAFLGGLVGVLPTILSVVLVERIYGILYALIPICAYQGYKIFRGRMSKGAFWITCLVSIFHLFSMEQIYFYINIVRELGLWPTPLDSILFYWSVYTPAEVLMEMATSFLFLALGIWIAWGKIRGTAASAVQNMGTVRESMVSYTPRATAEF